jgi:hypothetical protein
VNWQQLQTILWLRWRLSRNQWRRGGTVNAVLMLIVTVLGLVAAVVGGIGGIVVGVLALSKATPQVLLFVWDGIMGAFLFFWLIGLLTEIQRSESIDLSKLLHLPIALRQVFLLNYVASHLTPSLIFFLPTMLGLVVGLTFGLRWQMALLAPLVLSILFAVTAWTYCLRGWLIALMVNQRRRRAILMGITMAIVLVCQLPNFYFNVIQHGMAPGWAKSTRHRRGPNAPGDSLPVFLAAHPYVPPLWVGQGASSLAEKDVWPALWATAGGVVIGGLGLMRAYRSTLRFYQGAPDKRLLATKAPVERERGVKKGLLDWRLPAIPEEAGALALAFFRSMTRAPEVKMALASNFVVALILGATVFVRIGNSGETAKLFIATGVAVLPFFGLVQLMFNQFGSDRDGFRALVLLPTERKHILLAKNLCLLPAALSVGLLVLTVV